VGDQRRVQFADFRLTRLPVGRAEGHVWLSFVATGDAVWFDRDPHARWLLARYVTLAWSDGEPTRIDSSTSSGNDVESCISATVRDLGHPALHLTYHQNGLEIDHEVAIVPI